VGVPKVVLQIKLSSTGGLAMKIERILIKISGDFVNDTAAHNFIKEKEEKAVVKIIVGGGCQISAALDAAGLVYIFENGTRIIPSKEGKKIAKKVLENNRKLLRNQLAKIGVKAGIDIPVLVKKKEIFHINADSLAMHESGRYDRTFILTKKGREKKLNGKNVQVVYL